MLIVKELWRTRGKVVEKGLMLKLGTDSDEKLADGMLSEGNAIFTSHWEIFSRRMVSLTRWNRERRLRE